MKKAYSYVRFSRAEQAAGDSLRRQTAKAEAYCERHGLAFDNRSLQDLGVSAFRGKNAQTGALAGFLEAIKAGRVSKGSILIVESLDRLTRSQIMEAMELFSSILRQGIRIVTLDPEREYSAELINREPFALMEAILIMVRANEESERKSQRIKAAWVGKRMKAGERKLTSNCPYWLELSADRTRYVQIPSAVAVVRKIFKLAQSGKGAQAIAMQLCREDIPCIGLKKRWFHTYVLKILHNRSVLGEFQPMQMTGGRNSKREPIGEPIPDYFPRIISDADFYRVSQAMDQRRTKKGQNGKEICNLFKGLLFDAATGSSMTILHSTSTTGIMRRVLVPSDSRRTKGVKQISFPYLAWEETFLAFTEGLEAGDVDTAAKIASNPVDDLQAELDGITAKIADIESQMEETPNVKPLVKMLAKFEAKRIETAAALEAAKEDEHAETPVNHLQAAKNALRLLKTTEGEKLEQVRMMLRGKIASLVKRVEMFIDYEGYTRTCEAAIYLTNGAVKTIVAGTYRGELVRSTMQHEPGDYLRPKKGFTLSDSSTGHVKSFKFLRSLETAAG